MSDLISRKALIADCKKYVKGTPLQEMFETIIDNQPTVCDMDGIIADRDYWKAEAQKNVAKLGEIRILLDSI